MINGRNTAGQFTEGNSGKPKGSRNKATIAIESLLEGQAEALTQTAISKALDGDSMALRLCMDRIAPLPKDNTISFTLPHMENAHDATKAAGSVLKAVSIGEITPVEGSRVMGLFCPCKALEPCCHHLVLLIWLFELKLLLGLLGGFQSQSLLCCESL